MAIMLNSINPEVFNGNSAEFNGVERKRADIVTCGRLLMRERLGRDERVLMTAAQRSPMEFTAMLSDGEEEKRRSYASVNRDLQHDLLLFCAERCCSISGETVPADMDEFRRNQRKFLSDRTFLKLLAGIRDRDPHAAHRHVLRPGLAGGDAQCPPGSDQGAGYHVQRYLPL